VFHGFDGDTEFAGFGFGIRYEYGMFMQTIEGGSR